MLPTKGVRLGAAGVISLLLAVAPEATPADEAAVNVAASPAAVRISNFAFAPATLSVTVGTTVTWTNADDDAHTAVEKDRKFKSAALDTDDTFSRTFAEPGEYQYFCSIHSYMVGKIVVKPEGKTSSN